MLAPEHDSHSNPLHDISSHSEDGLVEGRSSPSSPNALISKMEAMEVDSGSQDDDLDDEDDIEIPNMWAKENRGLYLQYCAVGLLYGSAGTILPFCIYVKGGEDNVCSNASSLVFFAWNFKILFAIATDIYRPFGSRRKFWMCLGWGLALLILFLLAVLPTDWLSVSAWLGLLMLTQGFVMLSDVPADGYCVALGKMEPKSKRGQILATGQRLRFSFSMFAGFIQTFFLNGKSTSPKDCKVKFDGCWSFGLNMQGYYGLMFAIVLALVWQIWYLEEIKSFPRKLKLASEVEKGAARKQVENAAVATKASSASGHGGVEAPTWAYFRHEVWEILMNQTTLYLLIFVIGSQSLSGIRNQANTYLQYYVIELTMFQAGIDTMTSYMALVAAIWVFQKYLLGRNWRVTQWASSFISLLFGLMWIPAFKNQLGTMNAWYTIFVDLDQSFVGGLSQVLYSLSVIELSRPGLEATTYELIVTVGNACLTVASIVGTQLMVPFKVIGCQKSDIGECSKDSVAISSKDNFFATDGPDRYTSYSLAVFAISAVNTCIWVWFLPSNIAQCKEWQKKGEESGTSTRRAYFASALCFVIITYGFACAFLLLDEKTSCLKIVGGLGCPSD